MYSTGNYIQYPVINHMENNTKKRMYIYAVEQKLTQHCKSTIPQFKKEEKRSIHLRIWLPF